MGKKINLSSAILMAVCAASVTFTLSFVVFTKKYGINNSELHSVLYETDNYVKTHFYKETDEDNLLNGVISGYMSGLDDRYARYQNPSEYKTTVASDSGYLIGIGVTIKATEEGYMEVTELAEESSARDAGILIGDIITAVDGNDVAQTGYNEAVNMIKSGESGTEVIVTVKRGNDTLDIPIKRIEMTITTSSGQMIDDDIAYINISHFNGTTFEQMNEVLQKLLSDGAKSIIFDVRDNLGGMVSAVEQCTDPFLPEGDVAIATYQDGSTDVICKSDAEEMNIPIVVLINENSASGAELFAAALRDFGKAELVGVNSFGKGIMQTTHSLSNGGAITFTIATYQTVKSECYHEKGLVPDYEVQKNENDDITSVNPEQDIQLKKAIEIIKGK